MQGTRVDHHVRRHACQVVDAPSLQGQDNDCLDYLARYIEDEYADKRGKTVSVAWRGGTGAEAARGLRLGTEGRSWTEALVGMAVPGIETALWQALGSTPHEWLLQVDTRGWGRAFIGSPWQANGWDCGVFALLSAEHAVRHRWLVVVSMPGRAVLRQFHVVAGSRALVWC